MTGLVANLLLKFLLPTVGQLPLVQTSIRQASGKGITQVSLPQSSLENLKQEEEIWFIIQSRGFWGLIHPLFCCSVTKLHLTLCDPTNCSTSGSPVLQYLSEFAQIHVHQVSDAIQPTISSSAAPSPQSLPVSGAFPMSWLFASGVQSIGASLSALVLLMNIQGWFTLGLTDLISLLSKGLSRVSPAPQFESISSSVLSLLYHSTVTVVHDYWKNHSFD